MYPVSDDFLEALHHSHTSIVRCDLYRQGELIAEGIPVTSGQVTDDSQSIVRRRANLLLPPTEEVLAMLPSIAPEDGGLWPLGNELKIRSGIRFSDGTEELVPLGMFRIARPFAQDGQDGAGLTIDGYDRGRTVSRSRFTSAYVIDQGTNYATAIKDLVQSRIPWLPESQYIFMSTNYVTPQLVFTMDDDPMGVAIEMAGSIGAELFFDGDGRCILRPEPDPLYTPSTFSYEEGPDAILTSIGRDLDDEQAYNGVIVIGENTDLDEPIRAESWDTNPDSPTYYDPLFPSASVYGAVPYFIRSQYIYSQAQADSAAAANLARVMGIIERVQFRAVNNPAHESGDVITVGRERVGATGTHILSSFVTSFGDQVSINGTTRKRRAS